MPVDFSKLESAIRAAAFEDTFALLGALVDRRPARAWGLSAVVAVCFFAPDLFLVTTTRHVPAYVYAVLGVYLTVSTIVAVSSGSSTGFLWQVCWLSPK